MPGLKECQDVLKATGWRRHEAAGMSEGQLLGRFIEHGDDTAFAALVKRHGPLVWGACRRFLNQHDAEDAFQATFLVLIRKAASIRHREMVASWLYGVARRRTALRATRAAARRRTWEKQVVGAPELTMAEECPSNDLETALEHELSRLPEHHRVVVFLCAIEGQSRKEAARQLGLTEAAVASRLSKARAVLAKKLARQGLLGVSGGR
jgi:RNA polymerase sigma factor (sigma-70 family)